MNKKNIFNYFLISILSLTFLLIGKIYYRRIFNQYKFIVNVISINFKNRNFQNCNIKFIDYIPKNSILIVGHAYGSSSINKNQFISPKIKSLLDQNRSFIDILILTGDVFEFPTTEKWEKLYARYANNFKIFVTPGNHDYGKADINKKRYILNTKYLNYPFYLKKDNYNLILEDSFKQNWQINKKIFLELSNSKENYKNILLRHNIAINEFLDLANSKEGLSSKLPYMEDLSKKILQNLIIISGDAGASPDLPSFYCKEFRNIKVIANGIGNFNKDSILVLSEGNIFRYKI